ncbi:hypothetical protein HYFRA_00008791 [Hymenoscyphus fraxineus]|uniref:Uncharacterized protein n=1 Tax=Hymenoscyphus fraxineus TaxID=746836 RepID=A0A9N9L082_9HELO|nr:hypothetical protein HYFRA_00008791 [Hymenoscyphus fraxineus]
MLLDNIVYGTGSRPSRDFCHFAMLIKCLPKFSKLTVETQAYEVEPMVVWCRKSVQAINHVHIMPPNFLPFPSRQFSLVRVRGFFLLNVSAPVKDE